MHLEILIEFLLFVIAAVIFMRSVFLLSAVLNALVRNGRSVDYKPSWGGFFIFNCTVVFNGPVRAHSEKYYFTCFRSHHKGP